VPLTLRQRRIAPVARTEHLKQRGPNDPALDWQTAAAQLWKTARCPPAGQVA
jgi:hypothetical protein